MVQAYVAPKIDEHLRRLEAGLGTTRPMLIMQSNGGVLAASEARAQAVRTVLSVPAGGLRGAGVVAVSAGIDHLVEIFGTQDAYEGLSTLGRKRPEFKDR